MKTENKDLLNWFSNFRPDLAVDTYFVENLHEQFLKSNKESSLKETTFLGFVVANYRLEIIDFIYTALEENWSEVYEQWGTENTTALHIKNLKELIDSKDPTENQELYPHLGFNEENVRKIYLNLIGDYIQKAATLRI